jgi:hypothetical protein
MEYVMRSQCIAAILVTVTLMGCADAATDQSTVAETPSPPGHDVAIVIPAAEDARVAAGTIVEVVYPGGEERGIAHSLQRWDGTTWADAYSVAVSDPDQQFDEEIIANAWAPADEEFSVEAIGFTGSEGGQYTVIPPPTEPGTYRLCADPPDPLLCSAPFEVTSG